jgi:hypothetical protein
MNLTRHTITAGLAALGLAVCASPALAKGGGDINNTVISIAPGVTTTTSTSGSGTSGGGSGGGGRALRCAPTRDVDPVTGSTIMLCTSARV